MMLACSPPLVMTPWMRASGRTCWRIWSSDTKSWIMALSALTPRHGQDEAWAALPKNSHLTLMMPRLGRQTWVPQRPWIIMAASTLSKTPASISFTLPAPPSSAGVPITWIRPLKGRVLRAAASAAPAPAPEAAMTLWPQAWPMFGSASYSARMAMVGPGPWPGMVALKAVGRPTARSTCAPCLSRNSASQPAAFSSLKASSGLAWIRWLRRSRSSARRSTAWATRLLASSRTSAAGAMVRSLLPVVVSGRRSPLGKRPLRLLHQPRLGQEVERRHGHGLGGGQQAGAGQGLDGGVGELAAVDGGAQGRDGHHGLDGGDHLAHVADVGGAQPVGDGPALDEPRRPPGGGEAVEQDLVAVHRLVDGVVLDHLEAGAGGPGGALRAGDHPLAQLPHGVDARRAHVEGRGRVLGDDVGRRAAAGDDAVDPALGAHLLAWPMPGRASYSQRMATVGPAPVSIVARKAVATPATPVSTLKPFLARKSASQAQALTSS